MAGRETPSAPRSAVPVAAVCCAVLAGAGQLALVGLIFLLGLGHAPPQAVVLEGPWPTGGRPVVRRG